MTEIFESERLILKPFSMLTDEEKQIVGDSWSNPFNARYNAMRDAYGSVEGLSKQAEPTFKNLEDYDDCMYFRVAFLKSTGEVVGTCRFGKYYHSKTADFWDFGFNVLLKHWFKGYGVEMVNKIIEIAKSRGVNKINGGADIENYGSYKAMVKNGFDYVGYDDDGDYNYVLDLNKPAKTKQEIDKIWKEHLDRTKKDFGEDKFNRLTKVNEKIAEMVKRIQQGENEDVLIQKYFEELNNVEPFKFN
ncbi:MAG: GNAT family N-acetyltransferase [Clostridia bacterium]